MEASLRDKLNMHHMLGLLKYVRMLLWKRGQARRNRWDRRF
jgi:hypothetical protein